VDWLEERARKSQSVELLRAWYLLKNVLRGVVDAAAAAGKTVLVGWRSLGMWGCWLPHRRRFVHITHSLHMAWPHAATHRLRTRHVATEFH
jgi:hypothetical protein